MKMYVWLNTKTGKFSNSWTEEEHKKHFKIGDIEQNMRDIPEMLLIRYESLCVRSFIFNESMKITKI
jgi:hypothetical protein